MNLSELNSVLSDIQIELRDREIAELEEMVADSYKGASAPTAADGDNAYSIEPEGKVMQYKDAGSVLKQMRAAGRDMSAMDKYGPNASSFPASADAVKADAESSNRMGRDDRGDVDHSE